MSFRSRIYKVLLEQRSVLHQNFGFALGNFESRLNSIRSNVFIKIQRMFLINRLGIKTFPLNVKNTQPAGLNNFQVCFNFLSRTSRSTWHTNIQSGFISIRSGPLSVQPGYNMTPFESNNAKLVRFICRTVNKIQVLHSVLNTRSGRNKRQSIRNYKSFVSYLYIKRTESAFRKIVTNTLNMVIYTYFFSNGVTQVSNVNWSM